MSDSVLNQGEMVLRKAGGREYVPGGRFSAWLTLTNQRLLIQRLLGDVSSYPLSHVVNAREYEYWPSQFMIMPYKVLRIDFDNGGTILFSLYELPAWIQAIQQAKPNAPNMPYASRPAPHVGQPSAPAMRWVIIGGMVLSFLMFCVCTPIVFLIWLNLNSR